MAIRDTSSDLARQARLAIAWEQMVNPVRSIGEYTEVITAECGRLGLGEALPYLGRIATAAATLAQLVGELNEAGNGVGVERVSAESRLRHDLRTPLNAIIGYGELAIEDLEEDTEAGSIRADLTRLLGESRQLLLRIDAIVELSQGGDVDDEGGGGGAMGDAVARLVRAVVPAALSARPERETGRILVVDDNASNRDLLARRLAQDGHEVAEAASGGEVFTLLDKAGFDLILLDVLMPDMNGLEVLTRLKADERWHEIPVIMVSGLRETDMVLRSIELGADDYLPKPCDVVLLRARIGACLERRRWRERERQILENLRFEKERSETLLRSILPAAIVERLNSGETAIADRIADASILFADIVGFTQASAQMTAGSVVARLDALFSDFDALAQTFGVEKIKTIGDAYMAAAGLPEVGTDHVERMARFAVGILEAVARFNAVTDLPLAVRVGMHRGPVVAGIIGRHKFIYDVWGDTVNVASRLESNGIPNRIQVSGEVREAIAHLYGFESRGPIDLKGHGARETFLLV